MTKDDRTIALVKDIVSKKILCARRNCMSDATFNLSILMLDTIHSWRNQTSDITVQKLRKILDAAYNEYDWTTFDCNPEFVAFKMELSLALRKQKNEGK